MSKRVILCFDGEWNCPPGPGVWSFSSPHSLKQLQSGARPDSLSSTNVFRLYQSILPRAGDGRIQQKWYDSGIDLPWFHRFREGSFGCGLDRSILLGYAYLIATYEPGDEVFLYGFSRGAYVARSLVGLLATVGLPSAPLLDQPLVRLTRSAASMGAGNATIGSELPQHLHQLILDPSSYILDEAYRCYRSASSDTTGMLTSRRRGFQRIAVTLLGLWETVGPLGIPSTALKWLGEPRYNFHDSELSPIVQRAYHALAIDEHRADHNATLWTSPAGADQIIEQRWFAGDHGDLGGTHTERGLADIPLAWMLRISQAKGLTIAPNTVPEKANASSELHDSFSESFVGLRRWVHSRFYRPVLQTGTRTEVLDGSVHTRLMEAPSYRPKNVGLGSLLTFD